MKFINILLLSSFLVIGCSNHRHYNYERDYKHKIIKVVPEDYDQSFRISIHHYGKLTMREKKFLRKHFRKKYGHKKRRNKRHKMKVIFVLN